MRGADLGARFKMIDEALGRQANRQLQEVDMTLAQVRVLDFLMSQPDLRATQHAIEVSQDVSHPTVTGIVKRLEAKRYVQTYFSAEDARMKIVALTDAGRNVVVSSEDARNATERRLTRGFTGDEVTMLGGFLDRILANLRE